MSQRADRERVAAALGLGGAAPTDGTRVVTITGPAGIGKSQILRAVSRDWTTSGRDVVRVVGARFDQHVSLGGVRQLLDAASPHRSAAAPPSSAPTPAAGNVEMARAAEVIVALDALSAHDSLVVIDDAHWLDETSRRVIEFALRRLDDRSPPTLIAQRHGVPMVEFGERVHATGLSRREFDHMMSARLGDVATIDLDDAWARVAGNPLAAIEWSAGGGTPPTIDVGRSVAERISASSQAARSALCLLAVSRRGDVLDDAWSRIASANDVDLAATIRTSNASDLVEPDAPLRFRHPEYRDAAATCRAGADRAEIARALAATTLDADSAAWHLADACETGDDHVAHLLGEVARRSIERGTPIEAARASERAARLAEDPTLECDHLITAGEAWWYACFPAETARVTAPGEYAPVDLTRRIRLRRLHRAAVGWQRNVMETIRGYLDDASMINAADADLAAGLRVAAFIEACLSGQAELAGEIADGLATGLRDTPAEAASPIWSGVVSVCRAFAAILRGEVEAADLDPDGGGDPRRCGDLAALAFFASLDPTKLETSALNLLQLVGYGDVVLDHRGRAHSTLAALRAEAHARGATAISDFTEACLAEVERRNGRWASALSRTMSDIEIDPTRTSAGKAWQRAVRARMLAAQGGAEVGELAGSALDEAAPVGMEFIVATAKVALATEALLQGRASRARELLGEVEDAAHRGGALEPGALWFELDQLDALAACGDADGIRRVTERLDAHARRTGRPWSRALAALGTTLLGDTDPTEAAVAAAALGAPFEEARIELLLAERAHGRGELPVVDITVTRDRFVRLGATPFVRRCDNVRASGDDHGTRAPSAAGVLTGLTPAELRVAVTVGAGLTNGEAAAELFLSPRTVEAHLRAIFRKLEIRNRVELAAVVAAAESSGS